MPRPMIRSALTTRTGSRRGGFTLVEVLIVVLILGILAAMVIPQFADASRESSQMSFITDVRIFGEAAVLYRAKTGQYLPDGGTGTVPAGFEPYIDEDGWTAITPIGGRWDAEYNENGIVSAIGVHFNGDGETRDDAYMQEIDDRFDDGDLAAGGFRKIADGRYYFILAE